jgi:hypothetical protein
MIRILQSYQHTSFYGKGIDEPFALYSICLILLESDDAPFLQLPFVDDMVCL